MMAVGVHVALFMNKITGEQYIILASMAFTFYFSNKGETASSSTSSTTTSITPPFAGK